MRNGKTGSWTMNEKEIALFNEGQILFIKLRLEIESFFLFSAILLNKISNFPQRYFNHPFLHGITCGSHYHFWKTIRRKKEFSPTSTKLIKNADWLSDKVIYYRDKIITHTLTAEHFHRKYSKRVWLHER